MSASVLSAALFLVGTNMQVCDVPVLSPASALAPAQNLLGPVIIAETPSIGATVVAPLMPKPAVEPDSGTNESEIVVSARRRPAPGDPIEHINVKAFQATQAMDNAVFGPVALAYARTIPSPARAGLRNFLSNLQEPGVFLNFLLQHKIGKAAETLGRFAINSTVGAVGLVDMAKRRPFKLPRRPNGFANTLGFYGVKPGPFMYVPLIGPTTTRDLVGNFLDHLLLPLGVGKPFTSVSYSAPIGALSTFDRRAAFDEQLQSLRSETNGYAASRNFYLKRRQAEIDALHTRRHATVQSASGTAGLSVTAERAP